MPAQLPIGVIAGLLGIDSRDPDDADDYAVLQEMMARRRVVHPMEAREPVDAPRPRLHVVR